MSPTFMPQNVGNSWVKDWYVAFGADTWDDMAVATATYTCMSPVMEAGADNTTNGLFQYVIPFPCVLTDVFMTGDAAAADDLMRVRCLREAYDTTGRIQGTQAITPFASSQELISNSTDGSAVVNYIEVIGVTSNLTQALHYDGIPQAAGSAATGFVHASGSPGQPIQLEAGDDFTVVIATGASDSFGNIQVSTRFAAR